MKKTLMIFMVLLFALSIVSVAFASPYEDVPPSHWAYKAVTDLSKSGIIEGYKDGTFQGGRTMTRYEMAAIVANAMTKQDKANAEQKALIEKLSNEFSDELQKMDVRLTKVENKTRISMTGTQQFFFANSSQAAGTAGGTYTGGALSNNTFSGERLRLMINAADSEDRILLNARLYQSRSNEMKSGAETIAFDRYWATVKNVLGGTVDIGKQGLYLGKGAFVGWSGHADFVGYTNKSGALTTRVGEGNLTGYGGNGEISFVQALYKPNPTSDLGVLFYNDNYQLTKLYDVFGSVGIGNGMGFMFEAAKNDHKGIDKTGYYVALMSKATATDMVPQNNWTLVNPSKLHDAGWGVSYRHLPGGVSGPNNIASAASFTTILTDSVGGTVNTFNNVNVYGFDYYYVPIKNFQLVLEYNSIKTIGTSLHNNYYVSSLTFFF